MATIKQTAKPENIFKLGQILEIAEKNIITNIDFNVAKDYIPYIVEFSTENMLTETLPGENKYVQATNTWMFFHDEEETESLIQELFYDRDIQEETTTENGEVAEGSTDNVSKADIKLEVLNGSGDSTSLQNAIKELEGAGYKVARTGTTNTTSKTTIVNKTDVKETILKNMKDVLGTGTISSSEINNSKVDVTIVIGKDYK